MIYLPALMRAFPQVKPWNLHRFSTVELSEMLRSIGRR